MTTEDVLDALRNGDTAMRVAERLNEPPGPAGPHTLTRVVPALNRAAEEGLVERVVQWAGSPQPATWRFA